MSEQFNQHDIRDLQRMAEPHYAGFWVRVAASIIDTLLLMAVTLPLLFLFYGVEYWTSESLIAGLFCSGFTARLRPARCCLACAWWMHKPASHSALGRPLAVILRISLPHCLCCWA